MEDSEKNVSSVDDREDSQESERAMGESALIHKNSSELETYLNELLLKAAPAWECIPDADAWLGEIRGTSSLEEA